MKKSALLLFPLALVMSLTSCKKEEETKPTSAPTKTDLLTGKDWIVTAATIDPGLPNPNGGGAITDYFNSSLVPACSKDDFERYEKPNVYKTDEGAVRCSGGAQNETGTWTFNSTETVITTQVGTTAEIYNILNLTDIQLKVSQVQVIGGVNDTVTATYAKK